MYKFLLFLTMSSSLVAGDWFNWRGPNQNGAAEATNLPAKFSPTDKVEWTVDLKGTGASTPVVGGGRIFLTAADHEAKKLLAICIDEKSGKVLWSKNAGSGYKPNGDGIETQLGSRTTYASPSAVTDGKQVVFFFGNGDLVSFDLDGNEKWRHNIQKEHGDFSFQWTFSATPTYFKGKLYLPVLQRDEVVHGRGKDGNLSFVLAYDFISGKQLWKHVRETGAKKESRESFGTIIPAKVHGVDTLVIAGGDFITGHNPETGKENWRWGTWNKNHREQWWRIVPSPTPGPDNTFLVCAPKKAPVYAVQVNKDNTTKLLWQSEDRGKVTSDVPTPLYYQDHYYVVSDVRRSFSKVDPMTGKVLWTVATPGLSKYRSSPLGADGKIYFMNHAAEVMVYDAATGKLLANNAMSVDDDTYSRASIITLNNKLYIRTERKLYCISN
ncbi:MAG: PQQ-binding-like beta-propeller repeat protein [Lentisphaeraceae bacterium]|nr:PQQ-binding-like beta-propeller repeat protein [Lentisphaeraceae bacterium]